MVSAAANAEERDDPTGRTVVSNDDPSPGRRTLPVPPRAQTLRLQGMVNGIMRGLLRTPLICRALGRKVLTVYAVGRKTGHRYIVPVAYIRDGDALLIGTPFGWARNLRTGAPVQIRLKGKALTADVDVVTDEVGVVTAFAEMARRNRNFASFNKIRIAVDGSPDPEDLHLAWAAGARAIRFTPRPSAAARE